MSDRHRVWILEQSHDPQEFMGLAQTLVKTRSEHFYLYVGIPRTKQGSRSGSPERQYTLVGSNDHLGRTADTEYIPVEKFFSLELNQ
jgi:hypothetical protein